LQVAIPEEKKRDMLLIAVECEVGVNNTLLMALVSGD
jgi:hypothetical protein